METNKDKVELSAEKLAPNSLAYDLEKSKQTKNLLGSIRKETRGILRVVNAWKIEDVNKLQLKLQRDADKFTKLKERVGTGRKKRKPTEDERGPEERKPEEKKPQDKKPEEKKPQERRPSPESEAKRNSDFERERAARTRQLTDKGVPLREARRQAYEDTVKAQKYKAPTSAEPLKPKFTGGFKLPELPKLPNFKLNPEQLSRQAGLNKLVGRIFDVKDVADLGGSIAKKDVGGALTSAAGLLANIPKLSKLAYAPAAEKLTRGDVTGAGLDALFTKASGRVISGATNFLSRVPGLGRLPGFVGGVSSVANVPLAIYGALEATGGAEMLRQQGRTVNKTIKDIKTPVLREQALKDLTEGKGNLEQINRNPSGTFGLPALSTGGVATKPTMAIIGEGGEKEYIVPESKLSEFIAAQSQNNDAVRKPARMILGVVDNFISQFGSSSGDIRRMVGGDLLRLERIYGKDRFVLPIFTKGEGSFDNIIDDSFKKLIGAGSGISDQLYDAIANLLVSVDSFMGMAGGGQFGGISGPSGPVPQGTNADFWTLAAIASLESSNPEGQADVAQSVYNRLASGVYSGNTIKDLILAVNQYSPVGESDGNLWGQIVDRQTAIAAVRSHPRGQNAETMVDDAARNITNPQLQESARQFVGGRTDFAVPTAADIQPGGIADRTRHGHLFGWYVGSGAISYGRTNPGPTPIPNFQGITTTQQPPTGTTPRTTTQQTQPSSGLQRVQSKKRPKNGEFIFRPDLSSNTRYRIKVSNGKIISSTDTKDNYNMAPAILQPDWDSGRGKLYDISGNREIESTATTTTTSQPPQTTQRATSTTGLIMPTRGTIGDRLGAGRNHKGVDIFGPEGTPVVSPEDGEVVMADGTTDPTGYGNIVVVRGSKGYHHLAHLSRIDVTVGQRVRANQQIGLMGRTGNSTGSHLHWEIRSGGYVSGNVVDPISLSPIDASGNIIPPPSSGYSPGVSPTTRFNFRREVNRARTNIPGLNRALQRRNWRSLSPPTPLSQGGSVVAIQPVIVPQTTSQVQQPSPQAIHYQNISTFAYRNPVYPTFA